MRAIDFKNKKESEKILINPRALKPRKITAEPRPAPVLCDVEAGEDADNHLHNAVQ
jgi:hypothetical protein